MLNGYARPLTGKIVLNDRYEYFYEMSYLKSLPASKVFPEEFSGKTWSVGEGATEYVSAQLKTKWASDSFTKNRKPATPVICTDMGEHYLIAQYYMAAPGQYGAMVMGQDGYFYNLYSFFCDIFSSQEYTCYGLPIGDTQKLSSDGITYYTLAVQKDPCGGNINTTLFFFPTSIPPVFQKNYFPDVPKGWKIYEKE